MLNLDLSGSDREEDLRVTSRTPDKDVGIAE
jgi:hypothetical protein